MKNSAATALAVCGTAVATLALALYGYIVTRPYRLSQEQIDNLHNAVIVQFYASLFALSLGLVAYFAGLCLTAPARRYGKVAMLAGAVALVLGVLTPHVHSVYGKPVSAAFPDPAS